MVFCYAAKLAIIFEFNSAILHNNKKNRVQTFALKKGLFSVQNGYNQNIKTINLQAERRKVDYLNLILY